MNIQPVGSRILVRREVLGDITDGGIIIPESVKTKATTGIVISVPPMKLKHGKMKNVVYDVPAVKVGERVLFGKYSGHDFEHEGETLLFLREDEVLAVID